jgi:muramoyltetrapeptide carboxypeptidase
MFKNPGISGILCSRGGYGCLRLLNQIDYRFIRENPKVFCGYSDITALLSAFLKKTGLVTFHGAMMRNQVSGEEGSLQQLIRLLTNAEPVCMELSGRSLTGGIASGPLLGGNLSLLCHLVGTPFMPDLDHCILFLEDRGEALYRIDRMVTQLALSRKLNGISGLALGDFSECEDPKAIEELFEERLSFLGIPMATGLPVGHGHKNQPLPLGLTAELNTAAMTLTISESFVE